MGRWKISCLILIFSALQIHHAAGSTPPEIPQCAVPCYGLSNVGGSPQCSPINIYCRCSGIYYLSTKSSFEECFMNHCDTVTTETGNSTAFFVGLCNNYDTDGVDPEVALILSKYVQGTSDPPLALITSSLRAAATPSLSAFLTSSASGSSGAITSAFTASMTSASAGASSTSGAALAAVSSSSSTPTPTSTFNNNNKSSGLSTGAQVGIGIGIGLGIPILAALIWIAYRQHKSTKRSKAMDAADPPAEAEAHGQELTELDGPPSGILKPEMSGSGGYAFENGTTAEMDGDKKAAEMDGGEKAAEMDADSMPVELPAVEKKS